MSPYKPTPRQREILDALVTGDGTSGDIALRVGCSRSTVNVHLQSVMRALQAHTRVQLAVWWLMAGRYR